MTGQLITSDARLKTFITVVLPLPSSARAGAVTLESLRTSNLDGTPNRGFFIPEPRNDDLRYYTELLTHVIAGPTVLCAYVFALWSLTANISLTNAFPWSTGPLSNWLTWLALAVFLNLVASNIHRTGPTH